MWIVIDTTKEQLGIDDIIGAIAIISGQPVISTRGKPSGATKGTSVASLVSRQAIDVQLPFRLPMYTGKLLFTLLYCYEKTFRSMDRANHPIFWLFLHDEGRY